MLSTILAALLAAFAAAASPSQEDYSHAGRYRILSSPPSTAPAAPAPRHQEDYSHAKRYSVLTASRQDSENYSHARRYAILAKVPAASSACPKPYALGALCIGAPGRAFVPPCGCGHGATCSGGPGEEGYGVTCVAAKDDMDLSASANMRYGFCRKVGERCLGAPGWPKVEFGDGCCEIGSVCNVVDDVYGFKCSKPSH